MNFFDLIVIGAGPAGTAASIYAAIHGLKVALIEGYPKKCQPGESLFPGVEIIFRQLGVWNAIKNIKPLVYSGHYFSRFNEQQIRFISYSPNPREKWYGMQMTRKSLNHILRMQAEQLGVNIIAPCYIKALSITRNKITLTIANEIFVAPHYIDATGHHHLFARLFNIPFIKYSSQLIASFGYVSHHSSLLLPHYRKEKTFSSWVAKITEDNFAWVRVEKRSLTHKKNNSYKIVGGADVTWRIANKLAGPGFFLIGDAACVLDPSSGNGVLRALMTGIMAVYCILQITQNHCPASQIYAYYQQWVTSWFLHTVRELEKI